MTLGHQIIKSPKIRVYKEFSIKWGGNNYKLNEYLKKGEAEAPKTAESQTEGGATEPNPTRDN